MNICAMITPPGLCPMRRHKRLKYMQAVRSSGQRIRRNKKWYQIDARSEQVVQTADNQKLDVTCGMCIDAACAVQACVDTAVVCMQSVYVQAIGTYTRCNNAMQRACVCLHISNVQDVSSV